MADNIYVHTNHNNSHVNNCVKWISRKMSGTMTEGVIEMLTQDTKSLWGVDIFPYDCSKAGVWKSGSLGIWEFGDLGIWRSGDLDI